MTKAARVLSDYLKGLSKMWQIFGASRQAMKTRGRQSANLTLEGLRGQVD